MKPPLPASYTLRLRENQLFLALSIIVGVLAGLAAVLFALCIDRVSRLFFGLEPSGLRLLLVPTGVSIVTGVLLTRWFPDVRGSGVPQTEAAYHLNNGVIPGRVAFGKFLTGVLCVGSGHSMGREGPSVQIGAALASTIGRWVGVSPERVRALVPIGAVGALSAAFNTPVAAVLFALEEIIGNMNASLIGSAVVASVASVVVERSILGNEPLFHVPSYQLMHPAELFVYALLGVVGGAISLVFCKGLLAARAAFRKLPARTSIMQPAIGGALLGLILMVRPEVMGVGYDYVDQALNGTLLFRSLLILAALKLVATIVSYSSGNAGGIFAPTLFVGAMVGGAVGAVVHRIAPFPMAAPGAYALVGMGTLFAGIIRAPMTSVFMVFEITQDYQILVPLMVANLLSFVISRRFQPVPVYHALLRQDGVHLPSVEGPRNVDAWTVREVMSPNPMLLDPSTRIDSAAQQMQAAGAAGMLVGTGQRLVGILGRAAAARANEAGRGDDIIETVTEPARAHVHPDHRMDVLFERWKMADGVLPVLGRADDTRVEGVITIAEITRFLGSSDLGEFTAGPPPAAGGGPTLAG